MAKLIVEERVFKDRDTGISTNYKYYAVAGKISGRDYEVPLKQLTGAEKTALEMLAASEGTYQGDTVSRKSTDEEKQDFSNKNSKTILDDDEKPEKGFFD